MFKSRPLHWMYLGLLSAIATTTLVVAPVLAAPVLSVANTEAEASPHEDAVVAPTATIETVALNSSANDTQIVSPIAESLLDASVSSVTVESPIGDVIELRVNGLVVDDGQIGQTISNPNTGIVTQTWYDIDFKSGQNDIAVHRVGEGAPLQSIKVYRGSKSKYPEQETASAQGKATKPIAIISPRNNAVIDQPATSITVQSPVGETVELRMNGKLVDSALLGRTATDTVQKLTQETWYGVTLKKGDNIITLNRVGESEILESYTVQLRGEPSALKITTLEKNIPADGRSTVTVKGELLDENKNRSDWSSTITLQTTAGTFVGVDLNPDAPGFQVKAVNGRFSADLQSDLQAGLVRVQAKSNEIEAFHQLEFTTPLRPTPLITGVVDFRLGRRGTDFYDSLREFLPLDQDNGLDADASIAAFGTASIGEWSITGAVNSDRPLNTDCNGDTSLFRAVGDCTETLYPTYGDNSVSEVVAPSKDHLFLKIERSSSVTNAGVDYFMWGDYNTQEFNRASQQYSAIGRDLHGFKGNYNIGNLQVTGLYGNNADGFQRDTIAPDGTSGFYFLSRRLLIPGSEEIYLELEELNRPGTVLQRERLSRGADYDIDYDRGTIIFREPIARTDIDEQGKILVRRIVSTYQFESEASNTDIFGGRLQYNLSRKVGRESWLGTTYFKEDRGAQNFQLYGADAQISFGDDGLFTAEYAHSDNSLEYTDRVSGDAYRAEVSGTLFGKLKARGHFRTTDEGFSNTAATSFVPGQTRYGADLDAEVSQKTTLRFSYDHEDNFGVAPKALDRLEELIAPGFVPEPGTPLDNSLTTIRAGVLQKIGKASLSVDWVHRDRDDEIAGTSTVSDQLSSSLKVLVTKDLSLHAYNDLTLSNESDPLYPSRTTLGLDWRVHPNVSITFDNTLISGGQFDGDVVSSLGLKGQHTFSTDTTLHGELTMLSDGLKPGGMGGRFGIDQDLNLAPGLDMDFSYEYVFSEQFNTAAGEQFIQPFAVGPGASALSLTSGHSFSAGISYSDHPDLQVGARAEHRTNSKGSNTVLSANALGKINRDLTGLFSFKQASSANQALSDLGVSRDIKLGLAYRNPKDDTFNGLLRYEYRKNPAIIPETLLLGRGTGSESHLLAAEGIYAPNWRWELYAKAGFRHSKTQLAQDIVASNTSPLAQLRVTHRFNYQWDVTAEGRWIGQPSVGYDEFGVNAEVGYYLNPNIRLSAGYAFGDINDRDLGNSRRSDGPYLGVTLKLDNNLFKDFGFQKPSAPQQQESLTQVAQANPTQTTANTKPSNTKPSNTKPSNTKAMKLATTETTAQDSPLTEAAIALDTEPTEIETVTETASLNQVPTAPSQPPVLVSKSPQPEVEVVNAELYDLFISPVQEVL